MPQGPIVRKKALAKPAQRKNIPQKPRMKNSLVGQLAKKQQAVTMRKIENTVASKSGFDSTATDFNVVKVDKQLLGRLEQVKSKKKKV